MADSSGPNLDRSLLERLNALKPSTVTLDTSSNALSISATGIQPAAGPLTREDALSARLRTLRNKRQDSDSQDASPPGETTGERGPPPPYSESAVPGPAQPPPAHVAGTNVASRSSDHASPALSSRLQGGSDGGHGDELDSLFVADEAALDEILAGLGPEPGDWAPEKEEEEEEDESRRVAELLEKLGREDAARPPEDDARPADGDHGAAEDDSEGEEMKRAVQEVLSQAMDEAELDRPMDSEEAAASASNPALVPPSTQSADDKDLEGNHASSGGGLSLPEVPTDTEDVAHTSEDSSGDEAGGALSLPTVPTALRDPAPDEPLDFEDEISARMAALKGLGTAPATDAFGLPAAPTFQPGDRPVKGVMKRPGYTDEDQKTWCIVCLEDATVRCLGCDGDVFCARCFREMHVGPSAGYDERGHKWVKFSRYDL
ncbi:Abscission/NoCut checkpoint regulator [Pleurostoma richardsiae]|uniref:Abscission/NoCut checkpoint regulator n=1 Tax=Pleurostoma richardsiae TaxID=41990 RepID=A0AA38S7F2_9PEZI|nr:Abscission/NoCut checkpoint regulator [Pleurostoma richardsiae]